MTHDSAAIITAHLECSDPRGCYECQK